MKVTLREMFLLTLVAALALGWWLDHRRSQNLMRDHQDRYYQARAKRMKAEVLLRQSMKAHGQRIERDPSGKTFIVEKEG